MLFHSNLTTVKCVLGRPMRSQILQASANNLREEGVMGGTIRPSLKKCVLGVTLPVVI